jgi:hypothetical protein
VLKLMSIGFFLDDNRPGMELKREPAPETVPDWQNLTWLGHPAHLLLKNEHPVIGAGLAGMLA